MKDPSPALWPSLPAARTRGPAVLGASVTLRAPESCGRIGRAVSISGRRLPPSCQLPTPGLSSRLCGRFSPMKALRFCGEIWALVETPNATIDLAFQFLRPIDGRMSRAGASSPSRPTRRPGDSRSSLAGGRAPQAHLERTPRLRDVGRLSGRPQDVRMAPSRQDASPTTSGCGPRFVRPSPPRRQDELCKIWKSMAFRSPESEFFES